MRHRPPEFLQILSVYEYGYGTVCQLVSRMGALREAARMTRMSNRGESPRDARWHCISAPIPISGLCPYLPYCAADPSQLKTRERRA
jgi:hypothetical protein